jgi:hypothetical protein
MTAPATLAAVAAEMRAHFVVELEACRARRAQFVADGRDEAAARAAADVARLQHWIVALLAIDPRLRATEG